MKKIFLSLFLMLSVCMVKAQNASVDKVTSAYIGVKNALVGSNATLAKSRSKELVDALASLKDLTPAQQRTANTYLDKLKFDSRHISETTKIDHQREHFQSLSNNMYSLLAALKLNGTTLYQQYCPMKKAAWLSESEDIRNPYYGNEMLECGTVKATLAAAK
ncbi:DUF3347 domain-containing protein [Mucilaginibacter conchicola]|uniref:DUF3347 domain-containing protein n=1 Tax=Mucilaginibacter conchicola TaxID=2303333 RepID=A0A372NTK8_9SPHI|nr:DUF3347 domain-containing protein [Mucilaginibacter conchicola]RFZ92442.1 DUF3347 domain-containing protein [Mucilaginibacter conchicola]